MAPLAHPFARYRLPLLALAISAALHAGIIAGYGGRFGLPREPEVMRYSATLEAAAVAVEAAPAAPQPPPRKPRKPRRAALPSSIESLPPESATESLPEFEPAPQVAQAAEESPLAKASEPPEQLALAQPAAPIEPVAPKFPKGALPAQLSIGYTLTSPFVDGRAEYQWRREGDRYVISGEAEAVGFFTLFFEGQVTQESRGTLTDEGLRPDRFVERRPNAGPEGVEFDWPSRTVTLSRGSNRNTSSLDANSVDWLSMIFQLAHQPPKAEQFVLHVVTQRRLYEFKLRVLGEEEIEIPLGKVRTLHLRHDATGDREAVDVWLGIDQHYLPVKLRYPVARNRFMVEQVAHSISAQ